MARRKSRKKESGIAGTLLVLAIFFLFGRNWIAFGSLAVFAVAWWLGFERSTTCDVETGKGTPCESSAHGYLRACYRKSHKRAKRAILLSYIGVRRSNSTIMWARNSDSVRTLAARQPAPADSASPDARLARGPFRQYVTFLCGVVSASVAVIGLVFQILTFVGLAST